ncbi:uncharacterized protein MYCGRDRAFT_102901 [Zymoseptoria tritici IPO323]|uniref:Uncharacterized protein n=1 Tax=Zymoseptoria tritici (strain CBS 115943 / IPO323) TaxID=336722 RepID=F9WYM9_ZYMTI|nr:uncharacterized protein MYCGRDRAFT_102901 [Zymoseptoria tritici IPO323]EGP91707.1 hypothetical protein MYCGRDRAFT_102901 [Zymoseptoria tritici IPO323]
MHCRGPSGVEMSELQYFDSGLGPVLQWSLNSGPTACERSRTVRSHDEAFGPGVSHRSPFTTR